MIQDVTALLDKEIGSPFDFGEGLFGSFDGGDVFDYGEFLARDRVEMFDRDGKAVGIRSVLSLPILSAPFTIEKGQASTKVQEGITDALLRPANNGGMKTPMHMIVAQMCGAFVYKQAFFEKVLTFSDELDMFIYDKIAWRPAGTCALARDPKHGGFRGFRQMPVRLDDTDEIKIKAQRAFVYVHGQHINPLSGVSDLEIAYWCYQTKQKIRFLWYSFLEGQALPKTIVKDRDLAQAKKVARQLLGLKNGGIAAVEGDSAIDTFESSGKGAAEFMAALKWLDAEASNSVLAGFMDLASAATQGAGSLALSKDASDFFLMSEKAKMREMEDCINHYLIPDLVQYNYGAKEVCPEFKFGEIQQDSVDQAMTLLQTVATSTSDRLPREFFDELVLKVAGHLEMDVNAVEKGLEEAAKKAEEQAAQVPTPGPPIPPEVARANGAVGAATAAVIRGQQAPAA